MKNLVNKFMSERSHDHDNSNAKWNNGLGHILRKAVNDPEITEYDYLDSLPKRSGRKEHGSYGRWYPNISWKKIYRWIKSQVGKPVDKVYSEFCESAKQSDDYSEMELKRAFNHSLSPTRGEIQVCVDSENGYPYLGLVTPEGHTERGYYTKRDIYINSEGIICSVPKEKLEELEEIKKQRQKAIFSSKVSWYKDKGYIFLKGQWFEVLYTKIDLPLSWSESYRVRCSLCEKLGTSWFDSGLRILGRGGIRSIGLRAVSRKEMNKVRAYLGIVE